MTPPLVFKLPDGRPVWVEGGLAWVWSRVNVRWWPLDAKWFPFPFSGRVLTESERVDLVIECGSPNQPRVTAPGADLLCTQCGGRCFEVTHFGTKPFCSDACRTKWSRRVKALDLRPFIF